MTRKECLDKAAECVLQDRNREYGGPERSFSYIADLWSAYLRTKIEPYDAAAMMALFKLARLRFNPYYEDGWADLAGYAACGAELAGAEKAREDATRRWGEEYKKLREQAEGGCRQKGKDHSPEEPEFKPGDAVEWNSIGKSWCPAVYLREFGDFGHCVVRLPDGRERIVSKADLRKAEANYPENPDSSAGTEFKPGDKVQFRDEIPSTSEPHWFDGVYVERLSDGGHAVKFGPHDHVIHCSDKDIRPAPKAEGCEALVEKDAPQTKEELFNRIVDCNPSTFGCVHKPTGEELAEMAEEDEKHG